MEIRNTMKHTFFKTVLAAFAAVAALASCAHVEPMPGPGIPGEGRTLTVLCAQTDGDSRTDLNDLTPQWQVGDALWVSDGISFARVEIPDEFAGKDYAELSIPGSLRADTTLWFLYPYDEDAAVVSGKVVASVPVVQDGVFGNAHLAVGSCNAAETAVALKNASAMLKFSIDREDLDMMQVYNNTVFSGSFKITPSTGAKYSNNAPYSLKTIRMDFSGKGEKYLSCMAVSLAKGTRFTFVTKDGRIGGITTSKANTLANGSIYDLGELDDRIEFDETPAVTLGTQETANCYIVTEAGSYRIPAVQGNSNATLGDVAFAELLWETVNTSETVTRYSVVTDVAYCDGYIYFHIPDPVKAGNALVAAVSATGDVLWSWHIWILPDGYADQTYAEGDPNPYSGAVMMDRNLGALSATPGAVTTNGLLYQWGRKDPFPGTGVLSGTTAAKVAGTAVSTVAQTTENGTMEYAIAHPTHFIYKSSNDWLVNSDASLWSAGAKTVFDPCPAGYHIPFANAISGLTVANTPWNDTKKGRSITIDGQTLWFPAPGTRASGSGSLQNGGTTGYIWFDKNGTAGQNAWKTASDTIGIAAKAQPHAAGFSVRCQKYVVSGEEQIVTIGLNLPASGPYYSPYLMADAYASAKVFWGDENFDTLAMETFLEHLYSAASTYSLVVKGYSISGFKLKNLGDVTSIDVTGF